MKWWILFAGGGLGAVLRFALAIWVDERTSAPFPWGTLSINVIGCFCIGLVATVADLRGDFPAPLRLFLVAGVLGGFTTFSTFGMETWRLIEEGQLLVASLNAFGSLASGLFAVMVGVLLGRGVAS